MLVWESGSMPQKGHLTLWLTALARDTGDFGGAAQGPPPRVPQ